MRKSLKPWVLVTIGILFNILSAIITHYFIGINNQRLDVLQQKAAQFDTLIESQWRNKTEIDRTREFLLLLLTQSRADNASHINNYIKSQMAGLIERQKLSLDQTTLQPTLDFGTIEKVSGAAQQKIITTINDSYLEKLEIVNQQKPLKEKNSLLFTVAIFLQLTGLILVLSRDILR